jgi:glycosyltransferase involved in cell wall biosynthesis
MGMPEAASLGGPAACEPPFAAALRRLGVEVCEETYVYGEQLGGTTLRQRATRVLRAARRLRRRLRAEPFDVVHLNSSFDARALLRDVTTLRLIRRGTRARFFIKFHGSDAELLRTGDPILRRFVRRVLERAHGIGVLSTEERDNFVRAGVNERRVFVVKNVVVTGEEESATNADGVNVDEMNADGASAASAVGAAANDLRARLDVAADVPLLLFIARFIPAKGLLDVLGACALLRERGERFRLLCVGDGPARAEAEAEVARLRLRPYVRFFGYVPEAETRAFYQGSTALVFPTYHYEGFPMVIFKALAAGLPVVTTQIRAARDYLREPDNCLWVAPRAPEELADKLARLLRDAPLRAQMARNNRALAAEFNADAVAREYLAVYNQLRSQESEARSQNKLTTTDS